MRISDWSSDVCSSDLGLRRYACGTDRGRSSHLYAPRTPSWHCPGLSGDGLSSAAGKAANGDLGRNGRSCPDRSEEHTSELQSLMRISYAVFCLKKKKKSTTTITTFTTNI